MWLALKPQKPRAFGCWRLEFVRDRPQSFSSPLFSSPVSELLLEEKAISDSLMKKARRKIEDCELPMKVRKGPNLFCIVFALFSLQHTLVAKKLNTRMRCLDTNQLNDAFLLLYDLWKRLKLLHEKCLRKAQSVVSVCKTRLKCSGGFVRFIHYLKMVSERL